MRIFHLSTKKSKYLFSTLVFIIMLVIVVAFYSSNRVNIAPSDGILIYEYGFVTVKSKLTTDESNRILNIFNGNHKFTDMPSCGFSEKIAIQFEDDIYCVGCDGCPTIKINNRYFKISQEDREKLNDIFQKYGGTFPCV